MALDGAKEASGVLDVTVRGSLADQPVTASVTPQNFAVKLEPNGPRHYKATVDWRSNGRSPEKLGYVTLMVTGESLRVPVKVRDKQPRLQPGPQPPGTGASPQPSQAPATTPAPDTPAPANGGGKPPESGTQKP